MSIDCHGRPSPWEQAILLKLVFIFLTYFYVSLYNIMYIYIYWLYILLLTTTTNVVDRLYFVDAYYCYCSSKALAVAGQGLLRSLTLIIDGDSFGWVALLAASHGHTVTSLPTPLISHNYNISRLNHQCLKLSCYVRQVAIFFWGDSLLSNSNCQKLATKGKFSIVATNAVLR